jgi:hypothetical protein
MEAMKKEIARLNTIIASGCMSKEKSKRRSNTSKVKCPETSMVLVISRVARPAKGTSSRAKCASGFEQGGAK